MKKEKWKLKQVFDILAIVLNVEPQKILSFPTSDSLEKLGMDSLGMIRFILLLEENYGISFLDSDLLLSNFLTLERLFETLKKYRIGEKS